MCSTVARQGKARQRAAARSVTSFRCAALFPSAASLCQEYRGEVDGRSTAHRPLPRLLLRHRQTFFAAPFNPHRTTERSSEAQLFHFSECFRLLRFALAARRPCSVDLTSSTTSVHARQRVLFAFVHSFFFAVLLHFHSRLQRAALGVCVDAAR